MAWTGVKTWELEDVDNSGCILNIKSRGPSDQLDLKSRQKKTKSRRSRVTQFLVYNAVKLLTGMAKLRVSRFVMRHKELCFSHIIFVMPAASM